MSEKKSTTSKKTKGNGTKKVGRKPVWDIIADNFNLIDDLIKEGYPEREIAKKIGVAYSSWNKYKAEKTEFVEHIKNARASLVSELKKALYKKAIGFTYQEREIYKTTDEDGNTKTNIKIHEKYSVPDVAAANLLLKNYEDEWANDPALLKLKQQAFELEKIVASEKHWIDIDEINNRLEGKNE